MKVGILQLLAVSAIMPCCGTALAVDFTIKEYTSTPTLIRSTSYTGSSDITHNVHSTAAYIDIIPASDSVDIPKITLGQGPASGIVKTYIGNDDDPLGPDFRSDGSQPTKRGRNFKGLIANGLNSTCSAELYGGIAGRFGPSGTVDEESDVIDYVINFARLVRFDIGDALFGHITIAQPGASGARCIIESASSSSFGDITLVSGTITRVVTLSGDLKAPVVAENGDIDLLQSAGRITGYGGEPFSAKKGRIKQIVAATDISQFQGSYATSPMIIANEGIDTIEAPFVDGYIRANDSSVDTVSDGAVRRIVTTSTDSEGSWRSAAKLFASKVKNLSNSDLIDITGNLNGDWEP